MTERITFIFNVPLAKNGQLAAGKMNAELKLLQILVMKTANYMISWHTHSYIATWVYSINNNII